MAHSLAAHFGAGHFNAAAFADLAFVAQTFIFSAVALPVLGRSKNALAEQTVSLGFQSTVVNGFGLFHNAVRPLADLVGRSQTDFDGVKNIKFQVRSFFLLKIVSGKFEQGLPGFPLGIPGTITG